MNFVRIKDVDVNTAHIVKIQLKYTEPPSKQYLLYVPDAYQIKHCPESVWDLYNHSKATYDKELKEFKKTAYYAVTLSTKEELTC